jgi:hypothetical protein
VGPGWCAAALGRTSSYLIARTTKGHNTRRVPLPCTATATAMAVATEIGMWVNFERAPLWVGCPGRAPTSQAGVGAPVEDDGHSGRRDAAIDRRCQSGRGIPVLRNRFDAVER